MKQLQERLDMELAGVIQSDIQSRGATARIPGISRPVDPTTPIHELAPNFTWYEATHGFTRIPRGSMEVGHIIRCARLLQKVRDRVGEPLFVTSWYRPEPYNKEAGGAPNSTHLTGLGVDFYAENYDVEQMFEITSAVVGDLGGVGKYRNNQITHLDARGYRARWYY